MKNRVHIYYLAIAIFLLLGSAVTFAADAPGKGKSSGYTAAVQYPGVYKAKAIYSRTHGTEGWVPVTRYFTAQIACADAVAQLGSAGYWKGNLKKDGTCGPMAEPMEWAVGNRLNYEATADPGNKLPEAQVKPKNEDD